MRTFETTALGYAARRWPVFPAASRARTPLTARGFEARQAVRTGPEETESATGQEMSVDARRAVERDNLDAKALRRLSPVGYKVFRCLVRHSDSYGYCWPSAKTMMRETGIRDRHTLFRALKEVVERGFVSRGKMLWAKTGAQAVSLYRVSGPIEKLPRRAQERGFTLVRRKRTTPSVKSSHSPLVRGSRTTLVRRSRTPLVRKNHTQNSFHRNVTHKEDHLRAQVATLQAGKDDCLHKLREQLASTFPSVSRERLAWAVSLVARRAKTPPRSVAYFQRSLLGVFQNLEAEVAGWLAQEGYKRLRENDRLDRPSLSEELKCACAENDLPYSSEIVGDAIQAEERKLEEERRIRSELAVGRSPGRRA